MHESSLFISNPMTASSRNSRVFSLEPAVIWMVNTRVRKKFSFPCQASNNLWHTAHGSHLGSGYDYNSLSGFLIDGSDIGLEKERCSGSFHLAVRFLVIKDDSTITCHTVHLHHESRLMERKETVRKLQRWAVNGPQTSIRQENLWTVGQSWSVEQESKRYKIWTFQSDMIISGIALTSGTSMWSKDGWQRLRRKSWRLQPVVLKAFWLIHDYSSKPSWRREPISINLHTASHEIKRR